MSMHRLYAIYFHDGRVKIGVTGQIDRRLTYYRQEAVRNRVSGFTWCAFKPFTDKAAALLAEKSMCQVLREQAIAGHREWFEMSAQGYGQVLRACEDLRVRMSSEGEDVAEVPWLSTFGNVACSGVAA